MDLLQRTVDEHLDIVFTPQPGSILYDDPIAVFHCGKQFVQPLSVFLRAGDALILEDTRNLDAMFSCIAGNDINLHLNAVLLDLRFSADTVISVVFHSPSPFFSL